MIGQLIYIIRIDMQNLFYDLENSNNAFVIQIFIINRDPANTMTISKNVS